MSSAAESAVPSARITGFTLMRAAYNIVYATSEDEQLVKWTLQPGFASGSSGPVIIGDLQARSDDCFAGVQAAAFLEVDGAGNIDEANWRQANDILSTHAPWITHGLYDFAAQAMRAMTAGATFRPDVPDEAPEFELELAQGTDS